MPGIWLKSLLSPSSHPLGNSSLWLWNTVIVLDHQTLVDRVGGWGMGSGISGTKDGEEKGVPGTKSRKQEKGNCSTGTYQYTTRTASAIAARRIPAQSEDPTQ